MMAESSTKQNEIDTTKHCGSDHTPYKQIGMPTSHASITAAPCSIHVTHPIRFDTSPSVSLIPHYPIGTSHTVISNDKKAILWKENNSQNTRQHHAQNKNKPRVREAHPKPHPFSYDVDPSTKQSFRIPRKLTQIVIPECVKESIADIYDFLIKLTAMVKHTAYAVEGSDRLILNYSLHDPNTDEVLYLVAAKGSNNVYVLDDVLYTKHALCDIYELRQHELPRSWHVENNMKRAMNQINHDFNATVRDRMGYPCSVKWNKLHVFHVMNNKQRLTFSITKTQFIECFQRSCTTNKGCALIPIIMFNNNSYRVEYVQIVRIRDDIHIGVSYIYNHSRNCFEPTGIHLNKDKLLRQHQLADPHHDCHCLDDFQSIIDALYIGNADDNQNRGQIQSKNDALKAQIKDLQIENITLKQKCVENHSLKMENVMLKRLLLEHMKMEPRPIPTLTLPNVVNWTPLTSTSNSIETSLSYITPQSTPLVTPSSSFSGPRSVSRGVPVPVFCHNLNMGLTTSDHTKPWPDTAMTMTNTMTSPVSTTTSSMLAPRAPFIPQEILMLQKGKGRGDHDETTFDQEPLETKSNDCTCVNETDICKDNVDGRVEIHVSQTNPKKSVHRKLLQSLRYKVHAMPSPCLDPGDEYDEMNEWMFVCPTDKDASRAKVTPTQQNSNNNRDRDERDKNGNNDRQYNRSGGSNGSGSGFNGSDKTNDDDDNKESKDDTEDDHDGHRNEDDETDQFIYFLMHKIDLCDDVELRDVLSSFSDACMDKVLAGIQTVYNQKKRISKMRQSMVDSMRIKKQKKKKKSKSGSWSKMQRNMPLNMDIQSLNPLQIKSQYQLHKSFTSDVIPTKVIGIPAIGSDVDIGRIAYDYIIKSVA
eukprot:377313_1